MIMRSLSLLAAAAALVRAKAPANPLLVGEWVGTFTTAFALSADDPFLWSCLPAGAAVSAAHVLSVGADGTVSDGPWANVSVAVTNVSTWNFPGTASFAEYDFFQ